MQNASISDEMHFAMLHGSGWLMGPLLDWAHTLAPPGECDWTVRVRRRCGLMSNYLDHWL